MIRHVQLLAALKGLRGALMTALLTSVHALLATPRNVCAQTCWKTH